MAARSKQSELSIGSPGPFPIIENEGRGNVDSPVSAPRRRYSCSHYESCLNLAAALNWDNFTCRGCSGNIEPALLWRAHQALRRDGIAERICSIPEICCLTDTEDSKSSKDDQKNVA